MTRRELLAVPAAGALLGAGAQEEGDLGKLLAELESTRGRYWNVPREDGRYLNLMVASSGARRVLEVGTANGYSAIWIALGLGETGGALTTVEIDGRKVAEARGHLKRAGLDGRVTFVEGDAHREVRKLEGPWDFIFLDAEMGGEMDYFEALHPKLAKGGLLLRHNAIAFADAMKDYLAMIRKHPDYHTVILTLDRRDGFAVSYRKRG